MQRDGLEPASTEATLKGKRDRALLLLGFAGAFRRSEQLGASNGIACSYAGERSDYSLAAMADDLAAVITLAGDPPLSSDIASASLAPDARVRLEAALASVLPVKVLA